MPRATTHAAGFTRRGFLAGSSVLLSSALGVKAAEAQGRQGRGRGQQPTAPGTDDVDELVRRMRGHGAVTVGDTPEDAVVQMMRLEEQAKLNVLAHQTVGAKYQGIPQDQVKEYIARYSRNSTATLPVIGSTAAYDYIAAQVTPLD